MPIFIVKISFGIKVVATVLENILPTCPGVAIVLPCP
jgi:hypothetical protein